MAIQVAVRKGNRTWDSIKETGTEAFKHIAEFMQQDQDELVIAAGNRVINQLSVGGSARMTLEFLGYQVTIKRI